MIKGWIRHIISCILLVGNMLKFISLSIIKHMVIPISSKNFLKIIAKTYKYNNKESGIEKILSEVMIILRLEDVSRDWYLIKSDIIFTQIKTVTAHMTSSRFRARDSICRSGFLRIKHSRFLENVSSSVLLNNA